MSIITRFLSDVTEPQFKLARDLMAMAMADGEVTLKEIEAIKEICQIEGITKEQLEECLKGNFENIRSELPRTKRERENYLASLIFVIGADEYCAPQEIYLFQIIASRMGLNQMHVVSMFIMYASDEFFKGLQSKKILQSFMKNLIDPIGKYYDENMKHIRMMYDTIARHTEQTGDVEKDRKLLSQNLRRATEVFLQNEILVDLFARVKTNFERLLRTEEQRALMRYI